MGCSLAVCIATYERADSVRSFLNNCAAYYAKAGVDVYYYDSSQSNETKEVIEAWGDHEHIRYVRLSPEMTLSEKMYRIFRGEGWEKHYDFMVLSNDSTQFSEGAVSHLMQCLSTGIDIALYYKETRKFTEPQKFFEKCSSYLLHMGNTFLNVHTMLDKADWERYKSLFLPLNGEESWLNMGAYFDFYFERILELDHFTAVALKMSTQRMLRWSVAERKETIYDRNMIAYLCNAWPRTYGRLPKEYKRRWNACAEAASGYAAGKLSDFYLYSRKGMLEWRDYIKYWSTWPKVTKIPRPLLAIPAAIPQKTQEAWHEAVVNRKMAQLEKFCRNHKRIIIYGAGTSGAIMGEYLTSLGLDFEAYCATEKRPGKDTLNGHPVYEFETLFLSEKDTIGFVLAVRRNNARTILKDLKNCFGKKDVFYYPMLMADIREKMDYSAYSGFYN